MSREIRIHQKADEIGRGHEPKINKWTPVILPPGRLRLATRPTLTGSLPETKTIGIVAVAAFAACAAGSPLAVTMTVTARRTSSTAYPANRSYRPSPQRNSSEQLSCWLRRIAAAMQHYRGA